MNYSPYGEPVIFDPADFNRDGEVDGQDELDFARASNGEFDDISGGAFMNALADVNFDGGRDAADEAQFDAAFVRAGIEGHARDRLELNILYAGYWYDPHLGLYHVRHRVYDPARGRWMQRDPIGYLGGPNLYAYVSGEPMGAVDPMGLWPEWYDDLISALFVNSGPDPRLVAEDATALRKAGDPKVALGPDFSHTRDSGAFGLYSTDATDIQADQIRGIRHAARETAEMGRDVVIDMATGGGATGIVGGAKGIARSTATAASEAATAGARVCSEADQVAEQIAKTYRSLRGKLQPGEQAAHLLQYSAFKSMTYEDMLAVPLKGSIQEVNSEHWKFHQVFEAWWNGFRKGVTTSPTVEGYLSTLREALRATGRFTEEQIGGLVRSAEDELRSSGYNLNDVIDPLPRRVPIKTASPIP